MMGKHYLLGKKGMEAYGEKICELAPPSGWAGAENSWVHSALLIRTERPGSELLAGRQLTDSDCFAFSSDQSLVEIKNHLRSLHELLDCRGAAGCWPWYRGDCLLALLQAVKHEQLVRILGPMSAFWLPQSGFLEALGQGFWGQELTRHDSGRLTADGPAQAVGSLRLSQPEHWALQQWMRLRIESETDGVRRKVLLEEGMELPVINLSRTLGRISRASRRPSAFELAAASLLSDELEFETRSDPLGFTLQICEAWLDEGYPPAAASLLYERLGAIRFWDSPILHPAPVPFPLNYVDLLRRKLSYLGESRVFGRRSGRDASGGLSPQPSEFLRELASQDSTVRMPVEETSSDSMHLKWFEEEGGRAATLALGDRGDFIEFGDLHALQRAIVDRARDYSQMLGWNYFDSPCAGSASVYWIPKADRGCWLHVQQIAWVDVRLRRQVFQLGSSPDGLIRLGAYNWLNGDEADQSDIVIVQFSKPVPLQTMDLAVLDWDFSTEKESVHIEGELDWGWRASPGCLDWHQCLMGRVEAAIDHRLFRLSARISFEGVTLAMTLRVPDSSTIKRDLFQEYQQGEQPSGALLSTELRWPIQAEMSPVETADGSRLQLSERKAGELIMRFCFEARPNAGVSPVLVWTLQPIEPCIEIRRPHGGLEVARLKLTEHQELAAWGLK